LKIENADFMDSYAEDMKKHEEKKRQKKTEINTIFKELLGGESW